MNYLKVIVSAPNELKFVKMHLAESYPYIDKVILCESNYTHSGQYREHVFDDLITQLTTEERERLLYFPMDIEKLVVKDTISHKGLHYNERVIRGHFTELIDLDGNDVVISVDADEVIFRSSFPYILNQFSRFNRAFKIRLHQFYYRPDYLWFQKEFVGPTACLVKYYKKHPAQWRYDGKLIDKTLGAHFSWHLTVEEMITKLNSYSHKNDYLHLADKTILQDAIDNQKYPFEDIEFRIKKLNPEIHTEFYPESYKILSSEFEYLMK